MDWTNERKWIQKQANVYTNQGSNEPDRLIKKLDIQQESRFTALIDTIQDINIENKEYGQISVLDAGCASGAISNYIATKFPNVYVDALDIPQVINKIKGQHPNVNLIPIDLNKEFPKNKYTIIYATGVLEHIYNDWFFLKNCYNQLRKDGWLIITAPMGLDMFGQEDSLHIRIYPKNMLDGLLELAGFKIERSWEEDERKRVVARK